MARNPQVVGQGEIGRRKTGISFGLRLGDRRIHNAFKRNIAVFYDDVNRWQRLIGVVYEKRVTVDRPREYCRPRLF